VEEFQQWERDSFITGKEITMRACGTEERRVANMARFGHIMGSE